jgi:hypothetical protein
MSLSDFREAAESVVILDYRDPFDPELDAFRKELARISFSGFRIPIQLSAKRNEFARPFDEFIVDLEMMVYERDDPSKEVPIRSITTFDAQTLLAYPHMLHEKVYMMVFEALRHELDEHFKIDGVRVRDPHAGETP